MTEQEYIDDAPFSEEALDQINPLREPRKQLTAEEYDAGLERLRLELQRKVKAPPAN